MQQNYATFAPLDSLSVICFDGADAGAFLQGQLSADIAALPPQHWLRAAYCSPKGRALATMLLARRGEDQFAAFVRADIAESLASSLSRFVLRAKVKISRPSCMVEACVSDQAAASDNGQAREEDGALWVEEGGGACLRVRFVDSDSQSHSDSSSADAKWQRMQILRGIAWIDSATADKFVPQYFNWDLIGGINFQKGCYVGQEIIARLHYLGNVKRRGYVVRGEGAPPAAGDKVGEVEVINAVCDNDSFVAFVSAPRDLGEELQWQDRTVQLSLPPYGLPSAEEDKKPRPKV